VLSRRPSRLLVAVGVAGVLLVGVARLLDARWHDWFANESPLFGNVLAGLLALPLSGLVAYAVVDRTLLADRRRRWRDVNQARTQVAHDRLALLGNQLAAVYLPAQPWRTGTAEALLTQVARDLRAAEAAAPPVTGTDTTTDPADMHWTPEQWTTAATAARAARRLAEQRLPPLAVENADLTLALETFDEAAREWERRVPWTSQQDLSALERTWAARHLRMQLDAAATLAEAAATTARNLPTRPT